MKNKSNIFSSSYNTWQKSLSDIRQTILVLIPLDHYITHIYFKNKMYHIQQPNVLWSTLLLYNVSTFLRNFQIHFNVSCFFCIFHDALANETVHFDDEEEALLDIYFATLSFT